MTVVNATKNKEQQSGTLTQLISLKLADKYTQFHLSMVIWIPMNELLLLTLIKYKKDIYIVDMIYFTIFIFTVMAKYHDIITTLIWELLSFI